jgi:hypothetical protein
MMTPDEPGKLEGRRIVLMVLEERFGPLSPEVRRRVEALSFQALEQVLRKSYKVDSLKDLGLED